MENNIFTANSRLEFNRTIPSTNMLYHPKTYGNKTWLYKDRDVEDFQLEFIYKCKTTSIIDIVAIEKVDFIEVDFIFYLKQFINRRDVSNMIKATEDALARAILIDDSKTRKLTAEKKLSDIPDTEIIEVTVRCYNEE